MSRIKIFLLVLVIFQSILVAKVVPINEKWLELDQSNMINLIKVIKLKSSDINFYKKNLKRFSIENEKELGFGVKKVEAVQYGGYISNEITIYINNNKIFYFRMRISGEDDLKIIEILKKRNNNISKFISEKFQVSLPLNKMEIKRIKYEVLDEESYSIFKKSIADKLGNFLNIPINASLKNEYKALISPFEWYRFGTRCGYAGIEPKGRKAIEIIKKKNPKLLKNIIRGYSVEGRVYGVEAMLELASKNIITLTDNDILTIKKVLNLDILVDICEGCIGFSLEAKKIFGEQNYKKFGIPHHYERGI